MRAAIGALAAALAVSAALSAQSQPSAGLTQEDAVTVALASNKTIAAARLRHPRSIVQARNFRCVERRHVTLWRRSSFPARALKRVRGNLRCSEVASTAIDAMRAKNEFAISCNRHGWTSGAGFAAKSKA